MTRIITEPTPIRELGSHDWRVSQLERRAGGAWIYVGTYPGDPNTTVDSPPFKNSWVNVGAPWTPLRFRWMMDGAVEIEGVIEGGAEGTVVFTLPDGLWRRDANHDILVPGVNEETCELAVFKIEANGDVSVICSGVLGS